MKSVYLVFALVGSLAVAAPAFATSFVHCGTSIDDDGNVAGFELAVSSDVDEYSGPVGGTWNLKIGSENADWLPEDANVVAGETRAGGRINLEILISGPRSSASPLDTRYVIRDFYSETPRLTKYAEGGPNGDVVLGRYACVSAHD